jgi:putative hydrolase of the HAD superfamily
MHILFDLDDTLIHCNAVYDEVLAEFAAIVHDLVDGDVSIDDIRAIQQRLDIAGICVHGFAIAHFPQTLADTYDEVCTMTGRTPSANDAQMLHRLGFGVYDREFSLYPDVHATLSALVDAGYRLSVHTGGDRGVQLRKLDRHGLRDIFGDRVYVHQHKDAHALEGVLTHIAVDRTQVWMIGNSTRSDIVPAIQCGIGAIYVPPLTTWAYDAMHEPPHLPSHRWLCVPRLRDVVGALEEQRRLGGVG